MNTLSQAGRDYEKVFIGSNLIGLIGAVAAGLGVMALPRSRAGLPGIAVWENAPLPRLPDIFCGIYVRGGADVEEREQLADAIAAALSPQSSAESLASGRHTTAA
jgi:DNA-binding transcriptional LysR family regulator